MSNNNKISNFRRFLSYYRPYKALFAGLMFASVLTAGLSLALPLAVRHITGNILTSGIADVLPEIIRTGALMLAIIIIQTCSGVFIDWKGHIMGAKIERDLRDELFAHYQKLSYSFYNDKNTGELMSRLTNDLFSISEVYHHVPAMTLTYLIQLVGSISILLVINWRLAVLIFVILIIMAIYTVVFYKRLQFSYKVNQERIANINTAAEENLSGIRIVKSFANEKEEIRKFSIQNNRFYESRANIYKSESLLLSIVEYFFTPLIIVIIVVAGGIWISRGILEIDSLLIFIMYVAYLTGPVPKLAELIPFFQSGFTGFVRFCEIMSTVPEILDAANAQELKVANGYVEFVNVSFRYNKEHEYVLKDISLTAHPSETIAITGRSGIGKTTLCSLIPRLYDTCDGQVLIDGVNIKSVTQYSLRKQIGVVSQETFLFAGTIMENILYGKPGAAENDAIKAAKQANAHDFIIELSSGYATNIGQRGIKLSGGQQQRLCIARVFLKDPPILVLDEATSSLDTESEQAVLKSLNALAKGRTTFVIAHRPSTIRNADRVIMLTERGIIECAK